MIVGLARAVEDDGITKRGNVTFKGYNHNLYAGDGDIWDMENMTSDHAPLLAPRRPRYLIRTLSRPNGIYGSDGLYFVDGTDFYAGDELKGKVTDGRKSFAAMGAYILIMPDKAFYNRLTGEFGSLEASWSGNARLQDGVIFEEGAKANTIYAQGANWAGRFKPGDAVTISGCAVHTENNLTIVVREIDGDYLRFYENSFIIGEGGDNETALTVERLVPDMDFFFSNENRLWGCKGDNIYASKLGDPFNWSVFDGISTDSYAAQVGSAGDFTAGVSYMGYPCFFKEESIYKVYGDKPSNFQIMGSASLGVERGSGNSPAIAGETLFYLSRTGVVAYSGGMPSSVHDAFGTDRYRKAVGGTDGVKYYISMEDAGGEYQLFVYDTAKGMWHREDAKEIVGFAWDDELYMLDAQGNVWLWGSARNIPEGAEPETPLRSMVEFGDFVDGDPNMKGIGKLQIRTQLDAGAEVKILIQYDSDGVWREVYVMKATKKRSFYLPVIPRRCDHLRLRLEGVGQWKLYSLVREAYSGSELY